MTKFTSAIFDKCFVVFRVQSLESKQSRSNEVAHHEPPYQDLYCLQIWPFSSLVLEVLMTRCTEPQFRKTFNSQSLEAAKKKYGGHDPHHEKTYL